MTNDNHANREYKATLFHVLFQEPTEALALYNAVRHTSYDNPDDLTITTLEDVIYIGMKNDLSFLIGHTMNLYEHQSTFNPNMPLRGLFYLSRLYEGYVEQNNLDIYSSTLLKLPLPQYLVFYNGKQDMEDQKVLHLSDAFPTLPGTQPCLECEALMLNINIGHNKELMEHCRTLYEYAVFIGKVRTNVAKGMRLTAAINLAIEECIQEDILVDLLKKNRAEVCNMILTEYDSEFHVANEKKLSYEEGQVSGRKSILLILIQEYLDNGLSKEDIIKKLISRYQISSEEAEEYYAKAQAK